MKTVFSGQSSAASDRLAEKAAAASDAWGRGRVAAQAGDHEQARLWLDRATRLAPNDPRIKLDLAQIRLTLGIADPAAFEDLIRRYDLGAAWQGLIGAHLLAADRPAAVFALGRYLGRHCLPPDFAIIAGNVAGDAGWCALTPDDTLIIHAPPGKAVKLRLDGKPVRPMRAVRTGTRLDITAGGVNLAGSPLNLAALRRVVGVVASDPGGTACLVGWASRPAASETPPALLLRDAAGGEREIPFTGAILPADESAPFLPRHEVAVPTSGKPPYRIVSRDGACEIFGSPVNPPRLAAISPVPATRRGARLTQIPKPRTAAIVIPVFRDYDVTSACLEAVFAAVPARTKIIVVDDATPEPELAAWLDTLAAEKKISLLRHARNLGFPAAANAGLRAAGGRDVLLLNSDTLLPPGALATLASVAYAHPANGSVTPMSNEATICSYPDAAGGNPAPDLAGAARLNALAAAANGARAVEIPTGIGFCLFIRHDCLAAAGLFRAEIFAQGYGEEVDWCLRGRALGYRHMAATGAYVAHLGGVSFGAAGRALNARNAAILNHLHPGYDRLVAAWIAADPLKNARRRLDARRFADAGTDRAVLLISHNHGGGVARRVAAEMAAIRQAGARAIMLFPAAPADPVNTPFPWAAQLTDGETADYPALRFTLPEQFPALLKTLRDANVRAVVMHHTLGHHPLIHGIAAALGVPQTLVLHDYASFCPRVNLLTRPQKKAQLRYCGEPNLAGCVACVKLNGDETFERLGVRRLLQRSAAAFAAAAEIIVPSTDAARRIARHFPGITPRVTAWEDDTAPLPLIPPRRAQGRRVIVIGGIGPQKGMEILIDCATDAAARGLDLTFLVAGAGAEDARLLAAGIFVTGEYKEGEAAHLVRGLRGDLAFFPSIWPETWCYTLTEAWRAGLYAIAFDLGAPAARIRATGRGGVLPLGLPAGRINDALLAWQPDSRNAPVANQLVSKVV